MVAKRHLSLARVAALALNPQWLWRAAATM